MLDSNALFEVLYFGCYLLSEYKSYGFCRIIFPGKKSACKYLLFTLDPNPKSQVRKVLIVNKAELKKDIKVRECFN